MEKGASASFVDDVSADAASYQNQQDTPQEKHGSCPFL